MLEIINIFIQGVPYAQNKTRGNVGSLSTWTEDVIRQTKDLPHIKETCYMKVVFIFPKDKYPSDHPYGPDLDNYLKRFQDALNKTIFKEAPGNDGCVTRLYAEKRKGRGKVFGVKLKIYE